MHLRYLTRVLYSAVISILLLTNEVLPLNCLLCSGWNGDYSPRSIYVNPCQNANNACTTSQYCVKIVDPIFKGKYYKTYKSDCYASTVFTSVSNTTSIQSGRCYNWTDGAQPPRTYYYCFCNNHDYCNSASTLTGFLPVPLALAALVRLLARHL